MKTEKTVKKESAKKPSASKKKKKGKLHDIPMTTPRLEMCLWIVNELYRNPSGLSLIEIRDHYQKYLNKKYERDLELRARMKDDFDRRTFLNYKKAILKMFHVSIDCENGGDYKYRITEGLDSKVTRWMLDTFSTNEKLIQNHAIHDRILLEEIPSSETHLDKVLDAMRENHKITFKYMDFGAKRPVMIQKADPYCIKLYEKRWYMVVKQYNMNPETNVEMSEKKVYSLDRVQVLTVETDTFKMEEEFSADAFFYNAFAVRVDKDAPVHTVKLKIMAVQMPYFEKLKLHHSQKVVEQNDEYAIVTLRCALTIELYMKLMYYGPLIEVLGPDELRLEMARRVYWMAKDYEIDEVIMDEYFEDEGEPDETEDESDIDRDEVSDFRYSIFQAMKNLVNEDGNHLYTEKEAAEQAYSLSDEELRESIGRHDTPESIAEYYCQ